MLSCGGDVEHAWAFRMEVGVKTGCLHVNEGAGEVEAGCICGVVLSAGLGGG